MRLDRSTREEVKLIVELTAAQLELRTEKALSDLRAEIQVEFPKAIAHEIEACKLSHQKSTRWGIQTLLTTIAVGISFGSLLIAYFR